MRRAFANRTITRGVIIVEGNSMACQTRIEGDFVREFPATPVGPLAPNGKRITFDLHNIFRFDDDGRFVMDSGDRPEGRRLPNGCRNIATCGSNLRAAHVRVNRKGDDREITGIPDADRDDLARRRAAAARWAAGGQGASARVASRSMDARRLAGVYARARRKRLGSVSWVQS